MTNATIQPMMVQPSSRFTQNVLVVVLRLRRTEIPHGFYGEFQTVIRLVLGGVLVTAWTLVLTGSRMA